MQARGAGGPVVVLHLHLHLLGPSLRVTGHRVVPLKQQTDCLAVEPKEEGASFVKPSCPIASGRRSFLFQTKLSLSSQRWCWSGVQTQEHTVPEQSDDNCSPWTGKGGSALWRNSRVPASGRVTGWRILAYIPGPIRIAKQKYSWRNWAYMWESYTCSAHPSFSWADKHQRLATGTWAHCPSPRAYWHLKKWPCIFPRKNGSYGIPIRRPSKMRWCRQTMRLSSL